MLTRRRMRRLRFGGLGELSFVRDYSLAQQTHRNGRRLLVGKISQSTMTLNWK